MKYVLNPKQLEIIEEAWAKKEDPIADHIRDVIKSIYLPLGKWGKIQDPDNNCETNDGVIGVYEHIPGEDKWSILNRFDTNTKVRDRIKEFFTIDNPGVDLTNKTLMDYISQNKEKLFNGEHTQELVDLNKITIESGNRNEKYTVDVLQDYFGPNAVIKRFCSGDVRDTKKGMDISVEIGGKKYFVQVKPFEGVKSYVDEHEGNTFFQVKSWFNPSKYSEKNVEIFFFVNYDKKEHIAFLNERRNIKHISTQYTNFYEPYLLTNISFKNEVKPKKYNVKNLGKQEEVKDLFKTNERRLQNLEFKKRALELLIQKEIEKQNKIKGITPPQSPTS